MSVHYESEQVTLHHGDCLDVLASLPDASVDAVVTDPPYGLEFMGKEWDSFGTDVRQRGDKTFTQGDRRHGLVRHGLGGSYGGDTAKTMRAFGEWCELWSRECLRVLKPGGHLLAFGGTRTWHRLACAVEDAGFEVRDSLAWLYGSGFPKSLDVSKAIDKAAGAEREVVGSRVLTGTAASTHASVGNLGGGTGVGAAKQVPVTAPATPAAARWQGWGTALKPAFEPIVVARKPLTSPGVNVLDVVELGLRQAGVRGRIQWTQRRASGAGKLGQLSSSSSIEAPLMVETSAVRAGVNETLSDDPQTEKSSARSTRPGVMQTGSTSALTAGSKPSSCETKSLPPTEAPAPAVESKLLISSPLITSQAEERPTEKRSGARSTQKSSVKDSPQVSESFAGIATGLSGSWATVHIDKLADGTFVWPDGLPRSTAGGGTVANNVLTHGTGALNIDACRIATDDRFGGGAAGSSGFVNGYDNGDGWTPGNPAGRWPANVVLDESQAAELDKRSGELKSGAAPTRRGSDALAKSYGGFAGQEDVPKARDASIGGASRFFYVAKANADERVRIDGTAHPTVKPLDLMRWLVRLVTPPGGTVLEPFAGSGTTVEACLLEGFRCVAIEREDDYLPLIVQRLNRRRDPVAAVKAAGDDAGLFDLLGEEPA